MGSPCLHATYVIITSFSVDGRTFWPRTFWPGRFGQDVLATYIEKTDVLAKSIIYVLIIDIKATNIFNLLI